MPKFVDDIGEEDGIHGNEDLIHSVINYICLQIKNFSKFGTEVYCGRKRADIILVDKTKSKGMIIELKYDKKNSSGAIKQIDKKYISFFE